MMPDVPVRIAIFGHGDDLRQENNNTFGLENVKHSPRQARGKKKEI